MQERYEKEVARQGEDRGGGEGDASVESPPAGQAGSEPQAADSSTSQQLLSEVELKWQTEREEKRLLKEQLQSLEVCGRVEEAPLGAAAVLLPAFGF